MVTPGLSSNSHDDAHPQLQAIETSASDGIRRDGRDFADVRCLARSARAVPTVGAARRAAMQLARPGICVGQRGLPPTPLARPGPSHTSPRTNSVPPLMRSRPHVLPRQKATARPPGDSSATGSVTSSRREFANWCLTTSVCGTTSAGQSLTAERPSVCCPRRPLDMPRFARRADLEKVRHSAAWRAGASGRSTGSGR